MLAWRNMAKYYADGTPMTGMNDISAHIINPFRMLRSCWKWYKGMDIHHGDKTSYNPQYPEVFLKYMENDYWAKHRRLPIIKPESVPSNNIFPSTMASRSSQSSFDTYDLFSDEEEYLLPENGAQMTPGQGDHSAFLLTSTRLYLDSLPESPKNWRQVNLNLDDYHSDPMEIRIIVWMPDITGWWRQHKEMHTKYADLSNVAWDISSMIPRGVGVEASCSIGQHVVRWRQSITTGETLRETDLPRLFAWSNNRNFAGNNTALDTTIAWND